MFMLQAPTTPEEWKEVVSQYYKRWNYPGCAGSIDGKHIRISKPWNSGSCYYNYKGFFSIILLAVVNANYEFIYCDVGAEGKNADGGIWDQCDLHKAMCEGKLQFPPDIDLGDFQIPVHFISDDAFPMTNRVLKPYLHRYLDHRQQIFNYRLSRARRLVENVFGILAARFRVLKSEISMNVESATDVVLATCVLHNLLRQRCGGSYMAPGSCDSEDIDYCVVPGDWRQEDNLTGLLSTTARNSTNISKTMRDNLSNFFMTNQGEVAWQYERTRSAVDDILSSLQ